MKKMKFTSRVWIGFVALLCAVFAYGAGDAVQPENAGFDCVRGEDVAYISNDYYYRGSTLLFTNCTLYAGTSSTGAVQGLSNVTVQVTIGSASDTTVYTGTVASTTGGTWFLSTTVPTNAAQFQNIQVKITDENANSYIYPWKRMYVKDEL